MSKTLNLNLNNFYYSKFGSNQRFSAKIENLEYQQLIIQINQSLDLYFSTGISLNISEKSLFWNLTPLSNKYNLQDINHYDVEDMWNETDFDSIIEYYQSFKELYPEYSILKMEKTVHYSCGDEDVTVTLVGWKDEDENQFQLRSKIIQLINQLFELDMRIHNIAIVEQKHHEVIFAEIEKKNKEEKEYQLFLKLQKKYDNTSNKELK